MSYGISHPDPLLLISLHASLELEAFREISMDQCQTFIRTHQFGMDRQVCTLFCVRFLSVQSHHTRLGISTERH